jgi:DNA-binding transcriptional LysR family regulator
MDLQQIKYFLALADELHFWKTAEKVHITQSALSRQIQALESDLGIQLFERNKRNVKLTPAGEFLKEKWTRELTEINYIHQFARQIQLGENGTIRIAHPDSISGSLIPDIVSRISQTFPKLQIELVQVLYENQQEFLNNYKLDLVITRDKNEAKGIRFEKIYTDNLALVVPDDHSFQTAEELSKENLADQKFILPVKDEGSSYNSLIQQMFESLDIEPEVYLHSEFGSTIIALVRKGLGIAILPDSYMNHEIPGVRFIRLPFKTDLYLSWRVDDNNPVLANILKLILGI